MSAIALTQTARRLGVAERWNARLGAVRWLTGRAHPPWRFQLGFAPPLHTTEEPSVNTPPEAACEACGKSIAHRLSRWEESGRKGRKPTLCSREDNPVCHRDRAAARKQLSRGKQSAKPTVPGEFAADVTVSLDCAEPRGGRRRKYSLKGRIIAKRRKKSREVVVRFLPAPLRWPRLRSGGSVRPFTRRAFPSRPAASVGGRQRCWPGSTFSSRS